MNEIKIQKSEIDNAKNKDKIVENPKKKEEFWGEIEEFKFKSLKSSNNKTENNNSLLSNVLSSNFWNGKSNEIADLHEHMYKLDNNEKNDLNIDKVEESISLNTEKNSILDNNFINEDKTKDNLTESVINLSEINELRNNYIVGNISGEDIYDIEGRVIINKGQKITKDIIKYAEMAGRLSELILNMKFKIN
ncbi:MAG: hypothetical protein ABF289_19855 [Clostridiales bacterium]